MMAHHIDQLTINSLRRLHDLRLPHLGNVNLLVGENNSGKTTALEGVALFCAPLDPMEWLRIARGRTSRSSTESALENMRWLFPKNSAEPDDAFYKGEVRIEGQGDFPCVESHALFHGFGAFDDDSDGSSGEDDDGEQDSGSFSNGHDDGEESLGSLGPITRGAEIVLSARVRQDRSSEYDTGPDGTVSYRFELLDDERFTSREPPGKLRLPLGAVSPFSHRLEKLQVRQFTQATLTEEKLSLLESVILVDDEVAGLEILSRQGKRPALWVQHKTLGYVPLYALGDGVRRVLAIALGLIEAQNGVLLIDEIETAIHMSALSGVFRWLVRAAAAYNVQLFATTHSLEAVDAILSAERDQLSDVAIFRLPPPGSGRTVAGYKGMDAYSMRHNSGMELR